ncbi:MAG: hypothetical protein ABEN55_04895, partial [Bradymonadaceae bacterium]
MEGGSQQRAKRRDADPADDGAADGGLEIELGQGADAAADQNFAPGGVGLLERGRQGRRSDEFRAEPPGRGGFDHQAGFPA